MSKKRKSNKKEIVWNVINSLLAGALVFLGALTDGAITQKSLFAAVIVACSIAVVQFKKYWEKEEGEYSSKLGSFFGV